MTKIKRLLCFLIVSVMLFAVGCEKGDTTNVSVTKLPTLYANSDVFVYTVVVPADCSKEFRNKAKTVQSTLKETFDAKVNFRTDTAAEHSDENYEIVIGNTNRPESETAKKRIIENRKNNFFDFIYMVNGKKIAINAENEKMLFNAVDYFVETFCSSKKAWEKLNTESLWIYEAPVTDDLPKLAGVDIDKYTVVVPRDMQFVYGKDVTALTDFIYNTYGKEITLQDERYEVAEYEIIVGPTIRPESASVTVTGQDWKILMQGKKLVINGATGEAISKALSSLLSMLEENPKLEITDGFELSGTFVAEESDYRLVWGDEFNAKNLNKGNVWMESVQYEYNKKEENTIGGNSYVKGTEYVKLNNGCAIMPCKREGLDTLTSHISTVNTMQFKYGIIEIRAKLPAVPCAASFWLNGATLGNGAMTEYDIFETFGSATSLGANIHRWWSTFTGSGHTSLDNDTVEVKKKKYTFKDPFDTDLTQNFHTYAMLWDEDYFHFAVDGKVFYSFDKTKYDGPNINELPVYLLFGTSLGSQSYGVKYTVGEHPDYFEYVIDWVRLYQRGDNGSELYTRQDGNIPNFNNNREMYYTYH